MGISNFYLKTKKLILACSLLLATSCAFSQITLISSAGDGGFESGTTFAANNWSTAQGALTTRVWYCGTGQAGYTGNRAAFIGNSATNVGTNTATRVVHLYRSVTIPAGATNITLTFKYKQAVSDYSNPTFYDALSVYVDGTTPTSGTFPAVANRVFGPYPTANVTTYTTQTVTIPASFATGSPVNLIFTFFSDNVTPHGYGAVDDVNLTYVPATTPPNCAATFSPANAATGVCRNTTLTWASGGGGPTGYKLTMGSNAPNYDNIANNVDLGNVTSYVPATLAASTTYGWKIVPYNAFGDASGCTFNTFTTSSIFCYCTAISTSGSFEYISKVNYAAFNNSTANTKYGNYTGLGSIGTVSAGSASINVTVNGPYAEDIIYVFADWNQDGDFLDAGELAGTYDIPAVGTGDVVYNVPFTVPAGALLGATTIRVKMGDNSATPAVPMNNAPCQTFTYGEVEDYVITVILATLPPNCAASLSPANAATNQCINTTLSWANGGGSPTGYKITMGSNSPNYDNIANNVDLGNVTTYSPTLVGGTTYGWKVVPYNANGDATGCTFNTFTTGSTLCYCTAAATSTSFEYISKVNSGAFTNTNNTHSTYANYTSLGPIASVANPSSFTVNVTVNGPYAEDIIYIFADWNQDGDFVDAGELAGTFDIPSIQTGDITYPVTVSVPSGAALGNTTLRIKMGDNSATPTIPMNSSPCQTFTYGEVEDYLVNVIFVPCTNTPSGGTVTGPSSGSAGGAYTFTAAGQVGDNFVWQVATSLGGPYSDISGTTNLATTSLGTSNAATYYLRVRAYSAGCVDAYSNVLTFVVTSNDDVCNASLIPMNSTTFAVDNSTATAQTGEPVPPHTSCGSGDQNTWCSAETTPYVQHSVWYKFVAPQSGRVSISTAGSDDGFGFTYDTQVGVYSASSCAAVTSGGATLVGANDDAVADLYSEIPTLECLVPGQTYYIQVDGYSSDVGFVIVTLVDLGAANPPTISGCPSNILSANHIVNWTAPTANDNCPGVVLTSNYTPGSSFPTGTTTVTYTATDINNNTATCSFDVTVVGSTTWTGSVSTDWFNAGNWTPGAVPTGCGISAVIPTAPVGGLFPVINTTDVSIGDLTIQDNATVTINSGFKLQVCGNLIGGLSTPGQVLSLGELELNGTTNQKLSNRLEVQTLRLNNAAGASLQPGSFYDIFNEVDLQNGTLDATTGTIRFRSTADNQIAVIDDFSAGYTGTISGTIRAERYYHSSSTYDAHYMGSPINNASFSQFGAGGVGGYAVPTATCDETQLIYGSPYGTVARLDETNGASCALGGWFFETGGNADNARGYSVRKSGAGVLTVIGAPNLGSSYSLGGLGNSSWSNVSLQGRPMTSGWQLVANPYLAYLDISSTPGGFDAQKLVWHTSGAFAGTYQPATVVSPFQAFMVHVSAPGAPQTYTINGTSRVKPGTPSTFQKTNDQELTITAANTATQLLDVTTVAFNTDATVNMDAQYDGMKVAGALNRHTLYTHNANPMQWLAVNTLKSIEETSTVPVGFEAGISGNYSFSFGGVNSFDPTSYITLEDKKLNIFHDVRSGDYSFTADATDNFDRFVLHFTPAAKINTTNASCSASGQINIEQPGTASWNYNVTNSNGVVVSSGTLNQANPVTVSAATGVYTVSLTDANNYTVVKNIQVSGAQQMTAGITTSATVAEAGQSIDFTSTAVNATANQWDMGDGTLLNGAMVSHSYTTEGVYTVTVNAVNADGCNATASQQVTVNSKATGINNLTDSKLTIWSNEDRVYVDFSKQKHVEATIDIYNVLGQVVSSEKFGKTTIYSRQLNNLEAGYVVVSVKTDTGITTKKVFITNTK
ncbi:MAG: GEVED domain-containing protein [Chitinophagales bacterium]